MFLFGVCMSCIVCSILAVWIRSVSLDYMLFCGHFHLGGHEVQLGRYVPNQAPFEPLLRVAMIYMFLKLRPAAILDFGGSEIWGISICGTSFLVWSNFWVNTCSSNWVMAVKVKIQNGGHHHLGFFRSEISSYNFFACGPKFIWNVLYLIKYFSDLRYICV